MGVRTVKGKRADDIYHFPFEIREFNLEVQQDSRRVLRPVGGGMFIASAPCLE